jgi:transcriptional regulator with XRE-family HTH domain
MNLDEIGRRLRATRETLGLTQEEAAAIGVISDKAWSMWEQGERTPAVGSMLRIRDRFGISLDWIYAGDPARLPHELAQRLLNRV